MARRVEYVPLEEARRLGRELGIPEAQASRSAFRMLANHPDLVKHVYGLLTMLSTRNKLPTRLRELIIMRLAWRAGSEYVESLLWTLACATLSQKGLDVRHDEAA